MGRAALHHADALDVPGRAGLPAWRERVEEGERHDRGGGRQARRRLRDARRSTTSSRSSRPRRRGRVEILTKLQRHGAEQRRRSARSRATRRSRSSASCDRRAVEVTARSPNLDESRAERLPPDRSSSASLDAVPTAATHRRRTARARAVRSRLSRRTSGDDDRGRRLVEVTRRPFARLLDTLAHEVTPPTSGSPDREHCRPDAARATRHPPRARRLVDDSAIPQA